MRTFDAVIPFLKKTWKKIALGLLVLVFVDAIQLIVPRIIQKTIDSLGKEGYSQTDIMHSSLIILLMAGLVVVLRYLWRMLIIGNSWIIERELRQLYYTHLMKLSRNFFNKSKIGDLMAYATNDLNAVRMLFGIGFIAGADIFLMATSSFIFMTSINLKLTLYAIIPLPLLSVTIAVFSKKIHKRFAGVQEKFASLSGMIQESISGIRVIKAFAQEEPELKKMEKFSITYINENIKMAKISGFFHPFLGLTISLSFVIVLIFGGQATIKGVITIGGFIAFFSYLGMLIWPMIAIGFVIDMYQRGSASLKRLNEIWETEPEIVDNAETNHQISSLKGIISVKDLNFSYQPESPIILNNLNFHIEEGNTLAICGRTGIGKSTIVDLLTRTYNPPKNSIFIDGHDIHSIPVELLRKTLVMVPQDIFLFSDTIANNIAMGKPDASREDIVQAAKYAAVYDEIIGFEHGFDTMVGERGVTLSGGQKQRVAIARALLTNPTVLILDDALSAVDTKTENTILDHLINIRKGKTTIIIAHRISAIHHADNIIVIHNGMIKESGSHEELIDLNGIYKDLYDKQKIEERLEETE